jgi:predicted nucleic acid-binding protein
LTFVVDASITMSWCFKDESSELAGLVLERLSVDDAIAPAIWPYEIANSLLTAERRGRVSEAEVPQLAGFIRALPISVDSADPRADMETLISLGRVRSLSVYDASYLHLAIRSGLPLATADGKLRAACKRIGIQLVG